GQDRAIAVLLAQEGPAAGGGDRCAAATADVDLREQQLGLSDPRGHGEDQAGRVGVAASNSCDEGDAGCITGGWAGLQHTEGDGSQSTERHPMWRPVMMCSGSGTHPATPIWSGCCVP